MSMSSKRPPGTMVRAGRRLVYSPKASRRRTLTERKPPPTGVVNGPFKASLVLLMLSRVAWGSGSPPFWMPAMPPSCSSQANGAPRVSRISTTACVISGPIPSPGIRVAGILWRSSLSDIFHPPQSQDGVVKRLGVRSFERSVRAVKANAKTLWVATASAVREPEEADRRVDQDGFAVPGVRQPNLKFGAHLGIVGNLLELRVRPVAPPHQSTGPEAVAQQWHGFLRNPLPSAVGAIPVGTG